MSELDYKFRPDYDYLCRVKCDRCGVSFDVHAMANAQTKCPICRAKAQADAENKKSGS